MFSLISIAAASASIMEPRWPLFAVFAVAAGISGLLIKYTNERDHRLEEIMQTNTKLESDVKENFIQVDQVLKALTAIRIDTDKNSRSIENVALHLNIK